MYGTALSVNEQETPEIRHLDCYNPYPLQTDLGITLPWISDHFLETKMDMMLPLWL